MMIYVLHHAEELHHNRKCNLRTKTKDFMHILNEKDIKYIKICINTFYVGLKRFTKDHEVKV